MTRVLSVFTALAILIWASATSACMVGFTEKDVKGYVTLDSYLERKTPEDKIFIGLVVDVIDTQRPSQGPFSSGVPIYKVLKAIQNSKSGELMEAPRVSTSPCGGPVGASKGELRLYVADREGWTQAYLLASKNLLGEWYFTETAKSVKEKFSFDVEKEVVGIEAVTAAAWVLFWGERYLNFILSALALLLFSVAALMRRDRKKCSKGSE